MAPRLVDIELSSSPGTDGRYDGGETIELTVVWSEPVVIETIAGHSPPKVWLFYEGDSGPGIDWRKLLSPSLRPRVRDGAHCVCGYVVLRRSVGKRPLGLLPHVACGG